MHSNVDIFTIYELCKRRINLSFMSAMSATLVL